MKKLFVLLLCPLLIFAQTQAVGKYNGWDAVITLNLSSTGNSAAVSSEVATVGLSAGTYLYTFTKNYLRPPVCVGNDITAANAVWFSGTTSTKTVTVNGTTTHSVNIHCNDVATVSYYVDGTNGDDGWSGTIDTPNIQGTDGPWKTLTRAQTGMQAGLKYTRVRNGTYTLAANLAFTYSDNGTTWMNFPGENPVIDGASSWTFTFTGVNPMSVYGLKFQNLAANGFVFNGLTNGILRWNTFLNCNINCMAGTANTTVIDSNIIDGQYPGNPGRGPAGSPAGTTSTAYQAIALSYGSSNNKITHNIVKNTMGGGIGLAAGPSDPANNSNSIDSNILYNCVNNVYDEGAIYIYDQTHSATGNSITNNLIYNSGGGPYSSPANQATKAIYLDSYASYMTVSGNICSGGCGQQAWQIHGGNNNTFTHNVWDLSLGEQLGFYQSDSVHQYGMASNTFVGNVVYSATTYPTTLYTLTLVGSDVTMSSDTNNLYYSATSATIPNTTIVDSNRVLSNPLFTSPAKKQWIVTSASSPALTSPVLLGILLTNQGLSPYAVY